MRIVCQQTILMIYHALFVIFEKAAKFRWCFTRYHRIVKAGGKIKYNLSLPGLLNVRFAETFAIVIFNP